MLAVDAVTAATPQPVIRASLLDFTSEDNQYRSTQAAKEFTATLQALLTTETDINWVERVELAKAEDELRLLSFGLGDRQAALRHGYFVGAELIFSGSFSTNHQGFWTLQIEALDAHRTDRLLQTNIQTQIGARQPLKTALSDLTVLLPGIQSFLRNSIAKFRELSAKKTIGVLFIEHTGFEGLGRRTNNIDDYLIPALKVSADATGLEWCR